MEKDFLCQKIDFLKIDIEGPEYDILKDCGDSLKNVENILKKSIHYMQLIRLPLIIFMAIDVRNRK